MIIRIVGFIAIIISLVLASCSSARSPSISVANQSVQNKVVTISEVSIDKAGWLVLHPANASGEPDTSINLVVLDLSSAGKYTNLKVPIILVGDQTLFAQLYYDTPADGIFTSEDPPITVNGAEVATSFDVVGIPPSVEVSSQAVVNGTITISQIDIPDTGWAVLGPATPDGKVDLTAALLTVMLPSEGEYTSIPIPFTTTVQQTMFVVLHLDDPADGIYTYQLGGTQDLPVTINGNVVASSFIVSP